MIEDPDEPTLSEKFAISGVTLALKSLSQRFTIAVANLFTLITALGVWRLWYSIPDPTEKQLISLSIYAVFTLLINVIVFRRK